MRAQTFGDEDAVLQVIVYSRGKPNDRGGPPWRWNHYSMLLPRLFQGKTNDERRGKTTPQDLMNGEF